MQQRQLKQWFLKISEYSDRLVDEVNEEWPVAVRRMQEAWIGRSSGTRVQFTVS